MKARVSILVVSLAAGMAIAQETAPQQAASQTEKKAAAPATSTMPAEMKTLMYKGTLVDMSCTAATSTPSATPNTANRSAADTSNCPVKAESNQLGIKLDDGRVMKFDMVGNQRAQDELKNNKRWTKDLSANKPIRATVSGVISGEKLVVSSIH